MLNWQFFTQTNDDATSTASAQVTVENDFSSGNVIVSASSKTVAVSENAEYSILIVNPTNKLKVYRVVTESTGSLSTSFW